jgi:hypothetical protein
MLLKWIRKYALIFVLAFSVPLVNIYYVSTATAQVQETQFYKELKALPGVLEVKSLKFKDPFTEKYLVRLKQWIDPKDTTVGSFSQRVYVSHYSLDVPTVIVTEGYGGSYAESTGYTEELTGLFKTNQILVEHRYFGESTPNPRDWKYLTAANAAADHHHVVELFKTIYNKKWIATGISKGGETALIYRTLYPNDVDITVCYVAPLCFSVEDGRHEPFICCKVSTEAERAKVQAFQMEVLKRRNKIFPLFKQYCDDNHYTFKLPPSEIYDYCVLEFSFSFWQWGWKTSTIPSDQASDSDLFNYFVKVIGPDYFANEGIEPTQAFEVQAAKELGYYGYDTKPFEKYLKIKTAEGYLQKIFLPAGTSFVFDSTISQQCKKYLQNEDPEMIFIYGEFDPWSSPAVEFPEKVNMKKYYCPGGCHASRIRTFPAETQAEIKGKIQKWLDE